MSTQCQQTPSLATQTQQDPVQVVAPNTLPNYADEALKITTSCAVEATGTIVPWPAKGRDAGKRHEVDRLGPKIYGKARWRTECPPLVGNL